jgi:hypothetical protein
MHSLLLSINTTSRQLYCFDIIWCLEFYFPDWSWIKNKKTKYGWSNFTNTYCVQQIPTVSNKYLLCPTNTYCVQQIPTVCKYLLCPTNTYCVQHHTYCVQQIPTVSNKYLLCPTSYLHVLCSTNTYCVQHHMVS